MIHLFVILTIWLTLLLFEKLKFHEDVNGFSTTIRELHSILKEDNDHRKQPEKLLNLSFRQFKLSLLLFFKLILVNLPAALFLFLLFSYARTRFEDLLNLFFLLDSIIALAVFYFFRKYVISKV